MKHNAGTESLPIRRFGACAIFAGHYLPNRYNCICSTSTFVWGMKIVALS